MKSMFSTCLIAVFTLLSSLAAANESSKEVFSAKQLSSGKLYLKSKDQMRDIDELLATAKSKGKLAIIAMGANWCHDSQSFAKKTHHAEVKPLLEEHFELLFVDVGYLTNVKDVITRFGQPVIYATPTVLVVDPASGVQINQNNMHLWRDSAKLSIDETVEYFSDIAANQQQMLDQLAKQRTDNVGVLAKLNQQIDDFQQQQAERLYKAFSVIGPMLEKDEQGESVKNFRKYWKKVAKYRYKFTEDLRKLRQQAINISQSSNTKSMIEFPKYPAFEWEK